MIGIENKYSQPACSKAFSNLCIDNAVALSDFAPEIINLSKQPHTPLYITISDPHASH